MKCIFVKEKVLGKKPLLIHRPYFASISKISGWINPFLFYSYSFQFQKPFSPRAVFKSGMEILFFPLKFIPRSKAMYLIIKTPFLFLGIASASLPPGFPHFRYRSIRHNLRLLTNAFGGASI